jgi:hypothetical protein
MQTMSNWKKFAEVTVVAAALFIPPIAYANYRSEIHGASDSLYYKAFGISNTQYRDKASQ